MLNALDASEVVVYGIVITVIALVAIALDHH
jgi:hypothetical protein